jgi:hypothetical protein
MEAVTAIRGFTVSYLARSIADGANGLTIFARFCKGVAVITSLALAFLVNTVTTVSRFSFDALAFRITHGAAR